MVCLEFAGSGTDELSLAEARAATHDGLLRHLRETGARQTGPVEWRTYDPDYAAEALSRAGLSDDPEAAGLVKWLTSHPDCVLLIASVPYRPAVPA